MLNHTFQGGITGGYVIPGFNPAKERANFQKVCDYILLRRAEYLGEVKRKSEEVDKQQAMEKLRKYASELGLDPSEVLLMYK